MVVQSKDSSIVDVLLTDSTKVGQTQGVLKARRKDMSMAALIPGLEVHVEGTYNEQRQLVAKAIKFDGSDLERAQSVQAGVYQTEAQSQRNREELTKHAGELQAQSEDLRKQREQLAIEQQKIAANKAGIEAARAKIEAAVARFGQLDDYYILDELTIYFGNGKSQIESKYKPQLQDFAAKAKTVDAYMVQVVGYASSSGSPTVNQKLSEDRAANVTNFLKQEGDIPLTNVLAPGAMGESRQVSQENTKEAEAQNRRVVVRVLQNKGVAGLEATR